MANWEKLNKEFDDALDSMTKEDWDNWYKNVEQKRINQNKMKIEITHYGHKASYEFEHEDVTLDDLVYHLDKLLKLTGYTFDGELEIVNEEE